MFVLIRIMSMFVSKQVHNAGLVDAVNDNSFIFRPCIGVV